MNKPQHQSSVIIQTGAPQSTPQSDHPAGLDVTVGTAKLPSIIGINQGMTREAAQKKLHEVLEGQIKSTEIEEANDQYDSTALDQWAAFAESIEVSLDNAYQQCESLYNMLRYTLTALKKGDRFPEHIQQDHAHFMHYKNLVTSAPPFHRNPLFNEHFRDNGNMVTLCARLLNDLKEWTAKACKELAKIRRDQEENRNLQFLSSREATEVMKQYPFLGVSYEAPSTPYFQAKKELQKDLMEWGRAMTEYYSRLAIVLNEGQNTTGQFDNENIAHFITVKVCPQIEKIIDSLNLPEEKKTELFNYLPRAIRQIGSENVGDLPHFTYQFDRVMPVVDQETQQQVVKTLLKARLLIAAAYEGAELNKDLLWLYAQTVSGTTAHLNPENRIQVSSICKPRGIKLRGLFTEPDPFYRPIVESDETFFHDYMVLAHKNTQLQNLRPELMEGISLNQQTGNTMVQVGMAEGFQSGFIANLEILKEGPPPSSRERGQILESLEQAAAIIKSLRADAAAAIHKILEIQTSATADAKRFEQECKTLKGVSQDKSAEASRQEQAKVKALNRVKSLKRSLDILHSASVEELENLKGQTGFLKPNRDPEIENGIKRLNTIKEDADEV